MRRRLSVCGMHVFQIVVTLALLSQGLAFLRTTGVRLGKWRVYKRHESLLFALRLWEVFDDFWDFYCYFDCICHLSLYIHPKVVAKYVPFLPRIISKYPNSSPSIPHPSSYSINGQSPSLMV